MSESSWRASGKAGTLPRSVWKFWLPLAIVALLGALIASQSGPAQLAHAVPVGPTTVVVKPSTMIATGPTAWCFYDDDTDTCTGTGQMVTGPGTAPIGTGSASMTVGVSTGRQDILTAQFDGVALTNISTLTYQSYSTASSGNDNVFLQFDTNFGTGASAYQGRLSFSPSTTAFTTNTWQTWDATTADGVWYTSHAINSGDGNNTTAPCYQNTTSGCTWEQVKSYWPNATIGNPAPSGVGHLLFRVGNPGGDYTGSVDDFAIATGTSNQVFDFDPDKFCTSTCYVDASATGTGDGQQESPFSTISAALTHVSPNGTINVAAGTYNEDLNITTAGVTLLGAGAGQTIIVGPDPGSANVVYVGGAGATVDGVTISRAGNDTSDWASNPVNQGISIGADNVTLQNSEITHNRNGVYVFHANDVTIKDNLITDNRTGIQVNDGNSATVTTNNLLIENNDITNNWTLGILFNQVTPGVSLSYSTGIKVNNNNIVGNWYGGINARWNAQGDAIDATSNWFGSTTPSVLAGNSSEPGYASQIPVEFGGSATAPSPLGQDIIWSNVNNTSDPLTFVPMLCTGTDAEDTTIGFQPPVSSCEPGTTQPPSGGDISSSSSAVLGTDGAGVELGVTGFIATYNGTGTVYTQLADYSGNPQTDTGNFFGAGSQYFDVFASVLTNDPTATLTVTFPGLTNGQVMRWWDGTAWQTIVSNDGTTPVVASGGSTATSTDASATVVFGASSSPTLSQLDGTAISSGDANAVAVQLDGSSGNSVINGQKVTVDVVGKAAALQGVDIYLSYDPAFLKIGSCTGTVTLGTGLGADFPINYTGAPTSGYTTGCNGFEFNDTTGSLRITYAQNAGTPASGDDILLAKVTFTGQAAGNLTSTTVSPVSPTQFSDNNGSDLLPLDLQPGLSIGGVGATLTGAVQLQGLATGSWGGTTITLVNNGNPSDTYTATTAADGTFSVALNDTGTFTITAVHPGYLRAGNQAYVVATGATTLPTVQLLGGDLNGDGTIGFLDVSIIAANWNKASINWSASAGTQPFGPAQTATPDFNGDGAVNILDLSVVAANYGTSSITAWP